MENENIVNGHDLRRRGIRVTSMSPGSPGSARSRNTRNHSKSSDDKGANSFCDQSDESCYSHSTLSDSYSSLDFSHNASRSSQAASPTGSSPAKNRTSPKQKFTTNVQKNMHSSLDFSHNASMSSQAASPTRSSPAKNRMSPRQKLNANVQKDKPPVEKNQVHEIKYLVGVPILSILILFAIFFCFGPRNMSVQPMRKDLFGELKKSLSILKREFPSQSDRFWKVIGTAVKAVVVDDDPQHPAVILMAASESHSASRTSSCLAYRFIQNINQIYDLYESPYIDSKLLDHSSHSREKLDLDDNLKRKLDNRSMGVVIDHIESLSPSASLLFHGYCDGDNAPFKKATIALVYHTHVPSEKLTEKVVEQTLRSMWESELDEDKIPALLSRIANNIAMVSEETVEQLSKVCPDFI